ncbi:MAG: phosphotransferase family protein [Porticoccaceae bacterium]|nr:phosphotransferase family protein [Porticoccaceae bacterium]
MTDVKFKQSSVLPSPDIFYPAEAEGAKQWRDAPADADVQAIRNIYPVEDEFDLMLTRKMQRRALGSYKMPTLEEMSGYVHAFLNAHVKGEFSVKDECWLTGGASKIQFGFTLDWIDPERGRSTDQLVVRMEPAESLNATSRRREFEIIRAIADVVPVPRSYWMDPEGQWFPEPAIVYGFITGRAKPSMDRSRVSGIGTQFSPQLRAELGPQFTRHLAAIHTYDWRNADLGSFNKPKEGTTQASLWQLNRARRVWEEDRGEDMPLVESVANWLEDNMPVLDHASILHGDYRAGNFLFNEDEGKITGWLDWERCYIGDRHRDLAWATSRLFGSLAEDGKTFLVSGLVPEQQFFDDYQRFSGLDIDPKRLHYFRVLNTYQSMVGPIASTYRVVRLGKSHQDIVLVLVEGAAYPNAHDLLNILEERY